MFVKDAFEHVLDPELMLDEILRVASRRALLALDLHDKGTRVYQHVRPDLEPLRARAETAGWHASAESGNVTLYRRGASATIARGQ